MYQLLRALHEDPGDATGASLLFANKTPQDILLKDDLDDLDQHDTRIEVGRERH
jgi:NAD(P)H-flavin reductase